MKKLIILLMIVLLLVGCSGKKSDTKPAYPSPTTPSEKPAEKDLYEKFYGTWRTCAAEFNGTRFSMEQIEALGGKEQCDIIFVISKDGIIYAYSFYGSQHEEIPWTKTDGKDSITAESTKFVIEKSELIWPINDETTAIMSKISDRQDKDIIDELVAAESEKEESKPAEESESQPEEKEETVSDNTIRPEIKEAIDAYESFIDEYCDFMVKYSESNGTDLVIVADYVKFMGKLEEYERKMDALEEDLTDAEYWYYYEVIMRCNDKILKTQ